MMYLVQYRYRGMFTANTMRIHALAKLIIGSNPDDYGSFEVYRLIPDKAPEKLRYSVCNGIPWLEDRYRNPVEHCSETGSHLGRPHTTVDNIPAIFRKYYKEYVAGRMNVSDLARACGLSRPTVYKYMKMIG